jgi:hypothetical protein
MARVSSTPSSTERASNSMHSRSSLPASIFEKSSTSFRIVIRLSAHARARMRKSCRSASSCVSRASSVMPKMPFIGVRISWLIVARKALFASVAASAASRERSSARFASRSAYSASCWAFRKAITTARSAPPSRTRTLVS